MDATIAFASARNPSPTRVSSPSSASPFSRVPQRFAVCGPWRGRARRLRALRPQSQVQATRATASDASHHDVVVVGAGIVGLTIARHLLLHTPLSVAVVDAAVPCSGATGAGQGYVWMCHRTPGSDMWELAVRSKQLWEELAAEVDGQGGGSARERLGWMRTGSLLVGRTPEELASLEERTKVLSQAGIHAEFLSASSLHALEPALSVGKDGGAMFLPQDCQIDAFQAVSLIEKGHLLVVEKFDKVKLNHGLMEVGYADYQIAQSNSSNMASESSEDEHGALSISMTATLDTKGNLVLGSSREFKGFSREVDKSVVKSMWERAGEFFPAMKNVPLDIDQNTQIKIGHRPYMPDGKPVIDFIPDLPNVLIATGHEGNGLTMALGTAEMVTDMILGNPGKVDSSPFSIKHRFSGIIFRKYQCFLHMPLVYNSVQK
nr:unnamed protein product [Digitaria exilis]